MRNKYESAATIISLAIFWLLTALRGTPAEQQLASHSDIAMAPSVQVLLYAGDRFLAADIEAIRAAASSTDTNADKFLALAHSTVAKLNPCHEDNYWIGNASLSWGGNRRAGFDLLNNSMHCRYWDEWPAFFYAFNEHFFLHNNTKAQELLEVAAQRSKDNAAAFRTFASMLKLSDVDDAKLAIKLLQHDYDKAKDPKLREMLDKRIKRLDGLLLLRNAQTTYEKQFGKPLTNPKELLESGVLNKVPNDPLRIGYEFRNNRFHLREMKIK